MSFNSPVFAIFLPLVFAVYWLLPERSLRLRNAFLLGASYVFYGWWDYRFLALIAVSSLVDFLVGLRLEKEDAPRRRKRLLAVSVTVNLGILGLFKYFDFFIAELGQALTALGIGASLPSLRLVLPVGISFYTFQTLSYTIDIYRRQFQPTRDPLAFFAFVSFFPQLVAGPIERARNLLPQFTSVRTLDLDRAKDGLRQMLWGLVKKVVVADNAAASVDRIFSSPLDYDCGTLWIGVFLFAIQIYCDFSGYSDIAIGTARLFGFDLMRNFAFPYFARDIGQFWRRWHISLSTWFRDYVYIPLGGSRVGTILRYRNVMVVFVVSGLWHGANWTYVVWGALHGLFYCLHLLASRGRLRRGDDERWLLPRIWAGSATFTLTLIAWVFFRSSSLGEAMNYLRGMVPLVLPEAESLVPAGPLIISAGLLIVEWVQRRKAHGLEIEQLPVGVRWGIYYSLLILILLTGKFGNVPFIYFQF